MKEVLILEDKEDARLALEHLVKQVDSNARIYMASDEEEAYVIAMKKTIDVFLIDIILHPEIPGDQSGVDFVQSMRTVEKYYFTPIIFITTLYDPKLHMYSTVHCYQFIEKPFDAEKVKDTIRDALRYHTEDTSKKDIVFRVDGLLEKVAIDDIMYIENRNHKVYITTVDDKLRVAYRTCKQMLERLDSDKFMQCNRGTIVNFDYIKKVDSVNRYIYLKNCKDVLEIGPVMQKTFMSEVNGQCCSC